MATSLTIDGLEAPYSGDEERTNDRRAVITHSPSLIGSRFDWRIDLYGNGHWCRANGYAGRVRTEEEANRIAETWILQGIQPCEQAPA